MKRSEAEEAARERWFDVPGPVCRVCGLDENQAVLEAHHVCEKAWMKRHGLRHLIWDQRNQMILCRDCHANHTAASRRIEWADLTEDNLAFVAELEALEPPVPIRGHLRRYIGAPGHEDGREAA